MTRRSRRFGEPSSSIRSRYEPNSSARCLLLFVRRYDEAIELARRGLEFEPNSAFTLAFQGAALAEQRPLSRSAAQYATGRRARSAVRRSAPCRRMSWPSPATKTEARKLVRQLEEDTEAPVLLPVRDWLGLRQSRRRRHRQRLVPERHRRPRRLHGVAWRRALARSLPLRSALQGLLRDIGLAPVRGVC